MDKAAIKPNAFKLRFLRHHHTMSSSPAFSAVHRSYVKSLYKRFLVNSLNWTIRRDLWRPRALEIRARFEQNRCVDIAALCFNGALGMLRIVLIPRIEMCMTRELC